MSYLSPPRIGFISYNATVNPPTANNNAVAFAIDTDTVRLNLGGRSQEAFRAWLTEPVTLVSTNAATNATVETEELRAFWNYYGDNALSFGNARVNGFCTKAGTWLKTSPPEDPLLGSRVSIDARLVDLDPTSTFTTQIFSSSFRIVGQDERGQAIDLLRGFDPSPAYARWLNLNRPFGAAVFQCVVEREQLSALRKGYSRALDEFIAAIEQADGITLRYCLYAMAPNPSLDARALAGKFRRGEQVANPRVGRVLGSVTAWTRDELKSAPTGRLLYPFPRGAYHDPGAVGSGMPSQPAATVGSHQDLDLLWTAARSEQEAGVEAGSVRQPIRPGPAVAVVDSVRKVVMLDLLSTFPEDTTLHSKVDAGPVSLEARIWDPDGRLQVTVVGSVPYDQTVYEAQAGIVDVPYALEIAARIQQDWLVLTHARKHGGDREILLAEIQRPAIETDDRCVYLEQGDSTEVELRALTQGHLNMRTPMHVTVQQWRMRWRKETAEDSTTNGEVTQDADRSLPRVYRPGRNREQVVWASDLCVDRSLTIDGGRARLAIRAPIPGCFTIRFLPFFRHVELDQSLDFCLNVRVLPRDDLYADLKDEEITWDYVYKEVFQYYAMIYPIMSTVLPWSGRDGAGDETRVREFATLIRALIDERNRHSPMYMPITRELSRGKRALVRRWCDLQLKT